MGLGVLDNMLGPTFSPYAWAGSLFRSGVSLDSPLEGHSQWDPALIMPGSARSYLFIYLFNYSNHVGKSMA